MKIRFDLLGKGRKKPDLEGEIINNPIEETGKEKEEKVTEERKQEKQKEQEKKTEEMGLGYSPIFGLYFKDTAKEKEKARRREEKAKRKEEEERLREEKARRMEEIARRREEEEIRRLEENEAMRTEEKVRRREEEVRRKEEEGRRYYEQRMGEAYKEREQEKKTEEFEGKPNIIHQLTHPKEILIEKRKYNVAGKTYFSIRKRPWAIPFLEKIEVEKGVIETVELKGKLFWTDVRVYLANGKIISFDGLSHKKAKELRDIIKSEDFQLYLNR